MRRLMWFTVGFTAAAFLCAYWLKPLWWFGALLLPTSIPFLFSRITRIPGAVAIGAAVGLLCISAFNSLYLGPITRMDGQKAVVTVVTTEKPQETSYGISVTGRITWEGRSYPVLCYLPSSIEASLGDSLTGEFTFRSTALDGSSDSSYNRADGIFLVLSGSRSVQVQKTEVLPLLCFPIHWRHQISTLLEGLFPEDVRGFATALLLGVTSGLEPAADTALKVSGIRHVVAVSGLHVSFLFGLVYFLTGRRRWLVMLLGLPLLFLFAAIVGFTPSITRACLMQALMTLSLLVEREYDPPTALSFAVLVMLLICPYVIASISFQLSVGCMTGIFLFAERIRDWLMSKKRLGRFPCKKLMGWFSTSVGVSLGASITTIPLCAYHFGTVSQVSTLTNLLTLWVITYIFYGVLLTAVLGLVLPVAASGVAWVLTWGIRYVLTVAKTLAAFPLAAVYTESIYIVAWLIFCYVLLGVFLHFRRKRLLSMTISLTVSLLLAVSLSWLEPWLDPIRVTAIDVGQGQCILLQGGGRNYLVDCGGSSDSYAADAAVRLLRSQGIFHLDGIIVTHFDRDHVGGIPLLLESICADTLYLPQSPDEEHLEDILLHPNIIRVEQISQLQWDACDLTLIQPDISQEDNESGLCVLFQRQNYAILITGDRSQLAERELLSFYPLPQVDVLIAGHHGSNQSTGQALLDRVQPDIVIFSVGRNNPYGHPSEKVLERLEAMGCEYYRTDEDGNVLIRGE